MQNIVYKYAKFNILFTKNWVCCVHLCSCLGYLKALGCKLLPISFYLAHTILDQKLLEFLCVGITLSYVNAFIRCISSLRKHENLEKSISKFRLYI